MPMCTRDNLFVLLKERRKHNNTTEGGGRGGGEKANTKAWLLFMCAVINVAEF